MNEKELSRASPQEARDAMVWKLEGLSDAEIRRPMTPTGTNLLGLVKHLAGLEYGYLGEAFGRPAPERMSWIDDSSIWEGADMWVAAGESTEYIVGLYRRACAHADDTIEGIALDTHRSGAVVGGRAAGGDSSPVDPSDDRRDGASRRACRHRSRAH